MIKEHLPAASPESFIMMCGPPPMLKYACEPALEKLGFTSDQYFAF